MQKQIEATAGNADFQAATEIYNVARQEADIELAKLKGEIQAGKEEGFALGFLASNKVHRAACDFTDALMLYRVKKNKDYKKSGSTWEQFCDAAGYPRRTAEDIIAGIAPIVEAFSANLAAFSGLGLSDIRYLGRSLTGETAAFSEDGEKLIIGDETIPATPADVLAYIRYQKETHQKAITENEAALVAKDKVLADKEKLINKYARDLSRLEGKVKKTDLTPEEQELADLLKDAQLTIMDRLYDCRARAGKQGAPESAQLSYYFLLVFLQKISMDCRQDLNELYAGAEPGPWEVTDWEMPPDHVLVDGMPATRGLGKIYKEFMDKRNPPKSKE